MFTQYKNTDLASLIGLRMVHLDATPEPVKIEAKTFDPRLPDKFDLPGPSVDDMVKDFEAKTAHLFKKSKAMDREAQKSTKEIVASITADPVELQRRIDARKSPTERILDAVGRAAKPTQGEAAAMEAAGIKATKPDTVAAKIEPEAKRSFLDRLLGKNK